MIKIIIAFLKALSSAENQFKQEDINNLVTAAAQYLSHIEKPATDICKELSNHYELADAMKNDKSTKHWTALGMVIKEIVGREKEVVESSEIQSSEQDSKEKAKESMMMAILTVLEDYHPERIEKDSMQDLLSAVIKSLNEINQNSTIVEICNRINSKPDCPLIRDFANQWRSISKGILSKKSVQQLVGTNIVMPQQLPKINVVRPPRLPVLTMSTVNMPVENSSSAIVWVHQSVPVEVSEKNNQKEINPPSKKRKRTAKIANDDRHFSDAMLNSGSVLEQRTASMAVSEKNNQNEIEQPYKKRKQEEKAVSDKNKSPKGEFRGNKAKPDFIMQNEDFKQIKKVFFLPKRLLGFFEIAENYGVQVTFRQKANKNGLFLRTEYNLKIHEHTLKKFLYFGIQQEHYELSLKEHYENFFTFVDLIKEKFSNNAEYILLQDSDVPDDKRFYCYEKPEQALKIPNADIKWLERRFKEGPKIESLEESRKAMTTTTVATSSSHAILSNSNIQQYFERASSLEKEDANMDVDTNTNTNSNPTFDNVVLPPMKLLPSMSELPSQVDFCESNFKLPPIAIPMDDATTVKVQNNQNNNVLPSIVGLYGAYFQIPQAMLQQASNQPMPQQVPNRAAANILNVNNNNNLDGLDQFRFGPKQ